MPLDPRLTPPHLDPSYQVTDAAQGASWPATEEKLAASRNYWICTTRANGAPHSKPVWGVWNDALWFSTGSGAVTGRNLARDTRVSVHLESGDDVVILEGRVQPLPQREVPDTVMQAYADKYAFDPREAGDAEDTGDTGDAGDAGDTEDIGAWYRLVPTLAHTWSESDFQNSVARWEFE